MLYHATQNQKLQPVVETIESEVPSLAVHAWFFDDGNNVGTLEELGKVVDIVERDGPALGLHLNLDKSSIWCPLVTGPGEKDPPPPWNSESAENRHQTAGVPNWR